MADETRFTVGLLSGGVSDAFSRSIIKGFLQRAEEENVNAVIFPGRYINRKLPPELRYEYQFNTIYSLVDEDNLDAVIIVADSIGAFSDREHISRFIERYSEIPCILVASKDGIRSSIIYDNRNGVREGIRYLVETNGCRRFAILAGQDANTDSLERKKNCIECLEEYGITVTDDNIAYGDLSRDSEPAARELLDKNPDVEAIFSINDDMAVALYQVMEERGLVPGKDIYVFGYDNSVESGRLRPSLSSIWADPTEMARQAFDMALNLIRGRKTPSRVLDTMFIKRDSFGVSDSVTYFPNMETNTVKAAYNKIFYRLQGARGAEFKAYKKTINDCKDLIECTEYDRSLHDKLLKDFTVAMDMGIIQYADLENMMDAIEELFNLISEGENVRKDRNDVLEVYAQIYRSIIGAQESSIHRIIRRNNRVDYLTRRVTEDMMQFENGNDKNYSTLLRKLPLMKVHRAYLYLMEKTLTHLDGEEFEAPDKLYLKAMLQSDVESSVPAAEQAVKIKDLFRNDHMEEDRYSMIMSPLYSNENLYGFLLCDMTELMYDNIELIANEVSAGVKMLGLLQANETIKDALEQSMTALKKNNIELDTLSKSDPMTGIYNRRGFMEKAEMFLKQGTDAGRKQMFMYIDMDNLKIVNDRYGHDEGDFALCLIAEKVGGFVGKNGVFGRIGGDEFAGAVCMDMAPEDFKRRVKDIFASFNSDSEKEYNVTVSIGICEVTPDKNLSLEQALALADDDLYIDKQKRKKKVAKG